MKKLFVRAAQLCLILLVASVLTLPAVSTIADSKTSDEEVAGQSQIQEKPSCDDSETLMQMLFECSWICNDGTAGTYMVFSEEQCDTVCEDACGGACGPA